MPNIGTPSVNTSGSTLGASSSYTEYGLPDRIMPLGKLSQGETINLQSKVRCRLNSNVEYLSAENAVP